MNKPLAALLIASVALTSLPARADLELPRPSPYARAEQTVGLTELSVDYSSPSVHGRTIWGGLQPWGEVWRAGANRTTKLTFSREVTIAGTALAAGSYAFFVIPKQSGPWTLVINKDYMQGGASNYNKDLDLVRVDVTPETIPNRERLAYVFANFNDEGGSLDLEWEKVRVSLPFKVMTDAQVEAAIKAGEDSAWEFDNGAANFERQKKNYDTALAHAEQSIKIRETWSNLWTLAQIQAGKGNYKSAIPTAEKARSVGGKDAPKFFLDDSAKQMADWKMKVK